MIQVSDNRLLWVDYAKAFSILCVVLHHTQLSEPMNSLSYALCLAAFFVLSGYFFSDGLTYWQFLQKRSKQLLLPYIGFAILAYLIWIGIGRHVGLNVDEEAWWEPIVGIAIGTRDSLIVYRSLWFLTCLFVTENLYFLLHKITNNLLRWSSIVGVMVIGFVLCRQAIILPWGISSAAVMVFFYAIGHSLRSIGVERIRTLSTAQLGTILVAGILLFGIGYGLNPHTVISKGVFGNPSAFIIGMLGAATIWCSIGLLLERYLRPLPVLSTIGANTLLILGLHLHCFAGLKGIMVYLLHWDMSILEKDATKWAIWLVTILIMLALAQVCSYLKKNVREKI